LARVPSDDVRHNITAPVHRSAKVNSADASAVISARCLGLGAGREYCTEDKSGEGEGEGEGKKGEPFHWIEWRVAAKWRNTFWTEVVLNIRYKGAAPAALEN
jgi:hypothetical protein